MASPRNVLIVSHATGIGGAERSLIILAKSLSGLGYSVRVIIPGPGELSDELARNSINCRNFRLPFSVSHPDRLVGALRGFIFSSLATVYILANKPQYLHFNQFDTMRWFFHILGRDMHILAHVRDNYSYLPKSILRKRDLISKNVSLIYISRFIEAKFTALFQNGADSHLLYNALDDSEFSPTRPVFSLKNPTVIGTTGRLEPWKGHTLFLDVAESFVGSADYRFVMVDNSMPILDREHASRVLERARMMKNVDILPFSNDLNSLYANFDLTLLTSREEPFGRSTIESMACGVPVICVDSGASREVLGEELSYMVVAPDVKSIGSLIRRLRSDPDLYGRTRALGIARVRSAFGLRRYMERVEAIYGGLRSRAKVKVSPDGS